MYEYGTPEYWAHVYELEEKGFFEDYGEYWKEEEMEGECDESVEE